MSLFFPTAVFMGTAGQGVIAGAIDAVTMFDYTGFKSRQGYKGLYCRAGWITAIEGAIVERTVFIFTIVLVAFTVDAGDKQVRVIAGVAGKNQDFTGFGNDSDNGAVFLAQGLLGNML